MENKAKKRPNSKEVAQLLEDCKRKCCLCYGLNGDGKSKEGQIRSLNTKLKKPTLNNYVFLCLDHCAELNRRSRKSKGFTVAEIKAYRARLISDLKYKQIPLNVSAETPSDVTGDSKKIDSPISYVEEVNVRDKNFTLDLKWVVPTIISLGIFTCAAVSFYLNFIDGGIAVVEQEETYCFEEKTNDTLNILIVPFYSLNESNVKRPEKLISDRIKEITKRDSLRANVVYCEDVAILGDFDTEDYRNMLSKYKADLLIYGDIEANCSADKICLNWISKSQEKFEEHSEYTSKSSFSQYDGDFLRDGYMQESIDYIAYFFSALVAKENGRNKTVINYVKEVINEKLGIHSCLSNLLLADSYFELLMLNECVALVHSPNVMCDKDEILWIRLNLRLDLFFENYNSLVNISDTLIYSYYEKSKSFEKSYQLLVDLLAINHELEQYIKSASILYTFEEYFKNDLLLQPEMQIRMLRLKAINYNRLGKFSSSLSALDIAIEMAVSTKDRILSILLDDYRIIYLVNDIQLFPSKIIELSSKKEFVEAQERSNRKQKDLTSDSKLDGYERQFSALRIEFQNIDNISDETVNRSIEFLRFAADTSIDQRPILSLKKRTLADISYNLGVYYWELGQFDVSEEYLLRSLDFIKGYSPSVREVFSSNAKTELSNVFISKAKALKLEPSKCEALCSKYLDDALEYLMEVTSKYKKLGLDSTRNYFLAINQIGVILHDLGGVDEAIAIYNKSLARIQVTDLRNSMVHSTLLYNQTVSLLEKRYVKRSVSNLEACLKIRYHLVSPTNEKLILPSRILAKLYRGTKRQAQYLRIRQKVNTDFNRIVIE